MLTEFHAECLAFHIIILSVVMLCVIMLTVVVLNALASSSVPGKPTLAPSIGRSLNFKTAILHKQRKKFLSLRLNSLRFVSSIVGHVL